MKANSILIGLSMLACLTNSCDDNSNNLKESESVETYIELLKSNQYDSMDLPSLPYRDIPTLLEYRNETQLITNYPHNPISSLYRPECTLGMYVLWTIESIRAVSINSQHLIKRFPSQNPILALRNSAGLILVSDNTSHTIAAKSYFDWWNDNTHRDFNSLKNIDPLDNTDYKWH